ncbi:GDSL esterase/lipase At5g55050-like [Pyrus communis]|uniref:GDSL esterase/lipase At5g55050-like n=1 Tax=Pyrus communis TaxID=23211 RepID=UPI0035BF7125
MAQSLIPVLSLWLVVFLGCIGLLACSQPTTPAIYVFGDSTVDVGTNNYLPNAQARADHLFYGIDFPHSRATGRFSNGFNIVDYLAKFLGFELSPPPFLSLLDKKEGIYGNIIFLSKGVNFASGGSGIMDETGRRKWGNVVALGDQVQQFARVHDIISKLQGEGGLANISKSFFLISVGSNDIFEHFPTNQSTSAKRFVATLMSTYESRLRNLIDLGAKRFGIISVPPVGCVPLQRNSTEDGSCSEPMNEYAILFYKALQGVLQRLSAECEGVKYALADAYSMTTLIINNPKQFRFEEATKACCGKGNFNAELPCTPDSDLCKDRDVYLFWDQFHPTQAASHLAAQTLHAGGGFVAPMTFGQLALLA